MASSAGGKVGNMRALFEAKQELSSSPPSRGRSPAGSDIHSIRSGSSRPVSKIRTSFVAVEKSGNMGPILGLRRVSDVQDKPELDVDLKQSTTRSTSNAGRESIAEEKELEIKIAADKQDEDSKVQQESEEKAISNGDSETKDTSGVSSSTLAKGKKVVGHTPAPIKTSVKPKGIAVSTKRQSNTPKDIPGKARAEPGKAGAESIKSSITALRTKPSSNSPQAASTKMKSAATNSGDSSPASRPRVKYNPVSKPESRISTPRTSLASNALNENKSVKTRAKSPTRPVRLPAAAMASTASSAAKSSAAEKASSQNSSKPRISSDSDFLARMMRPTAASASKTHEKLGSNPGSQKVNVPRPKRTSPVSKRRISEGITRASEPAQLYSTGDLSPLLKDGSNSRPEKAEANSKDKVSVDSAAGVGTNEDHKAEGHPEVTTAMTSNTFAAENSRKRTSEDITRRMAIASYSAVPFDYSSRPAYHARTGAQPYAYPVSPPAMVSDISADMKGSERQAQETRPTNSNLEKDEIPVEASTTAGSSIQSAIEDDILKTNHSIPNNDNEVEQTAAHNVELTENSAKVNHDADDTHKDHDVSQLTEEATESEPQLADHAHEQHITGDVPADNASLVDMADDSAEALAKQSISDIANISKSKTETPETEHEDDKHVSSAMEEENSTPNTLSTSETPNESDDKAEDPTDP